MKINFCMQKITNCNTLNPVSNGIKSFNNNVKFKKENDVFIKSYMTFKGKDYSLEDIELAKKFMGAKDDSWKEQLYNEEYQYKKKNGYIECRYSAHNGCPGGKVNLNEPSERIFNDIITLGLGEIPVQVAYSNYRKETREHIDKISLIISDLISAKSNEDMAETARAKESNQRRIKYADSINEVEKNELCPKLLDKIQARKEGKNVEVPNCVMVSNGNDAINKELIEWALEQANANIERVDLWDDDFDFVDFLEQAEENYQKTKEWNLIHVKNMDKMINPNEVQKGVIASMKDIMCATAKDYHSTLIFSTTCPSELDDTAIETNRVTRINTDNIESIEELKCEDIERKLQSKDYVKNSPLSAINDLADYTDLDKEYRLDFDSTESDIDRTIAKILEKLTSFQRGQFEPILNKAKEYAWYCTGKIPSTEISSPKSQGKGLSNVIGMKSLKQILYNEVIDPIKNPQKFKDYGIEGAINGFLLYGPPGCGKTFIMENLADELGRYCVKITPSSVGSQYIHQTAINIKDKFQEAMNHAPSIVFIDEIEALAPRRDGLYGGGGDTDINEQVTELLTQMNNCKEKDILIVCASNEPQRIDSAIKRTGRLDKKIFVPNPDFESRYELIEKQLEKVKMKDDIDIDLIAEKTNYYTAKDIEMVIREASAKAMGDNRNVTTDYILSAVEGYHADLSERIVESYRAKGEI